MPYTTRRAIVTDVPALVELMEAFYAEAAMPLDRDWAGRAFEQLLGDPTRGAIWLVLDGDSPVGHVVLTVRFSMEYGGLDAFIDDLYVRPEHRRSGVATAALAALFEDCRLRGVLAVHVEVGQDNDAARKLYERFGLELRSDDRLIQTVRLGEPSGPH